MNVESHGCGRRGFESSGLESGPKVNELGSESRRRVVKQAGSEENEWIELQNTWYDHDGRRSPLNSAL
jgi:hypothetical protein